MPESGTAIAPLVTERRYRLFAYSAPRALVLKSCKAALWPETVERMNQDCLVVSRGDDQYVFIWDFGTIVFFNVPVPEHESYISKLGINPYTVPSNEEDREDDLAEDSFAIEVREGVTKVAFSGVTIPNLDISRLHLVAQGLAQSSALELVEWEVEEYLKESDRMAHLLKSGWVRGKRNRLLKFLGEGLAARHRLVNQLSLVQEPDKTWDTEDLYILYRGLFDNFDIKERIEKLEKMISLCSEVSEILLGIMDSRRSETLEMIIIVLILIEVVRPLFG